MRGSEVRGELGFEVRGAFVEEAVVLACAGQALFYVLFGLGELSYLLLEGGVLGGPASKTTSSLIFRITSR
ncbi:hypothetical protein PV343_11130 [Streptomyces sp. WI03-4A]|uniref:hypothetical protein n=1 Tax=Streptomyces sp. WI03-4A TaxID=3028706 RepID=UPI0029B54B4F|nr:hypothetical protein [Streptomyces sp. WI03-4A]MDX2592808.1 hypothetical protein [Streptomyces sp. WI03-4A]